MADETAPIEWEIQEEITWQAAGRGVQGTSLW